MKVVGGRVQSDRITFYTRERSVTAIRNKNGGITLVDGKEILTLKDWLVIYGIWFMPILVKAFILFPLIERKIIGAVWYLVPVFLYCFLIMATIVVARKGGKEKLRNSGAETKVSVAYRKLQRIPTEREADSFSRSDKMKGMTVYSAFITTQLIGFIIYMYMGYVVPEVILFIIALFFRTMFPFNCMGKLAQYFTTMPPQSDNLELAIKALNELERIELRNRFRRN